MSALLALLASLVSAVPAVAQPSSDAAVRAAIVEAVRQRMGANADVAVDDVQLIGVVSGDRLHAIPDPSARLGRRMRFTLTAADAALRGREAAVEATVHVVVEHAHARDTRERGAELTDADVVVARHEITAGALRPWPTVADVVHARLLRALTPDACIARTSILALPAVRTGQDVVALARVSGVEATARLVAAASGDAGDVIRVVNRQSRRALKARVVSPGVVEIIP